MSSDSFPRISIILPCRDEERALEVCLEEIKGTVADHGISAEIIVSDSSRDHSPAIARRHNVRLIKHDRFGYGAAILEGVAHANGDIFFIADADGSYDFRELPAFVSEMEAGNDIVIGRRMRNRMQRRAMPWHHKYIGNPCLSFLLRICTGGGMRDAHCGMRAIRRDAFQRLALHTTGMEFASEFILEAHRIGLRIIERPIAYRPRHGESKLRSFRDGWRHLRFMLLYSPILLFFVPGALLGTAGFIMFLLVSIGVFSFVNPEMWLLIASAALIIGYQLVIFGVFARVFAAVHLGHPSELLNRAFRYLTIEVAGLLSLVLIGIALGYMTTQLLITEPVSLPAVIAAVTLLVVGVQTLFSSFMISLLSIKKPS
jgi:glycosyltransferase involved in cell wall biosynthesis